MKTVGILLVIITLISKSMGFFREIILSYYYGASSISDAYIISITIPTVIFAFIGRSIATAYIPLYSNIKKNYGKKEALVFTNTLINLLLVISTIIIFFVSLYSNEVVKLFASGFYGDTLIIASRFTQVSIFGIYFLSLINIFSAYLQLKGNYYSPALIGIPLNVIYILSIYVSYKMDMTIILAYGILTASLVQFVLLVPSIKKQNFKYSLLLNPRSKYIKEMLILVTPVLIGVVVNDINKIVDRSLASNIVEGGITALNYADKINIFVQGIVVTSIATIIYPLISSASADGNIIKLKSVLKKAINLMSLIVIPASFGSLFLARPIVEVIYARGVFDEEAIILTSSSLFYYSLGMLAMGLRDILSRPFYALHDTKTPMINGSIGVLVNIALNFLLSRYMGISGLALATSISAVLTALLLIYSLRIKLGAMGYTSIVLNTLKIVSASLLMGFISRWSYMKLNIYTSNLISLLFALIIGIIIYFILVVIVKVEESDNIINLFKNKLPLISKHFSKK